MELKNKGKHNVLIRFGRVCLLGLFLLPVIYGTEQGKHKEKAGGIPSKGQEITEQERVGTIPKQATRHSSIHNPHTAPVTSRKWEHHGYYEEEQTHQPQLQHQLQEQVFIAPSKAQKTYESLFLDDYEKLLSNGRNEEAAQLAAKEENECYDIINRRLDRNKALTYALVSKRKYQKNIDKEEHFSKSFFRIYSEDPQKLINDYEENITALEKEYKTRQLEIAQLEHKKKTHKKELLLSNIDEHYHAINLNIDKLKIIAKKTPALHNLDLKELVEFQQKYRALYEMITKEPEKINEGLVNDLETKLYTKVTSRGWSKDPTIIDRFLGSSDKLEKEDQSSIYTLVEIFKYHSPDFIKTIKNWIVTDPNIYLDKSDEERLEKLDKAWPAFKQDTEEQIATQKARINFIKANPNFFKISARPRAHNLGIEDPEYWHSDTRSPLKLGDNIIVGVIDSFDTCKQNSRILHKSINPEFIGKGCTLDIGREQQKDHGINVAGVIVSDLIEQNKDAMTVGVAPSAHFEMLSFQSLRSPASQNKPSIKVEWTVDKMANAITQLAHTGELNELGISMAMISENPIVNSPANILNWSMTTSNLGQFGRNHISQFEGEESILVLVKSLQSKLWVIAAGNDGINITTTTQHRLKKALAVSPATQSHVILVTNLMQDGLTLHPTSNIPGANLSTQGRTLSAPGTGIIAMKLMESEESPAYEEDTYGTSMAAPHVSGIAAVVLSNHPKLTIKELADCLLEGATPLLINDEGVPYELPSFTMGELDHKFSQSQAEAINIRGTTIKRADWQRGKENYGQGRVSLKGALEEARKYDLT